MSATRSDSADAVPATADPDVLVLLCGSLAGLGSGLDLADVAGWLEETVSSIHVEMVDDLCGHPKTLRDRTPAGTRAAVLGLCSSEYSDLEIQHSSRKAGLDPLAVEKVNLGAYCALPLAPDEGAAKAKLMLAAAVARARAFPGSKPENVKPYLIREHQRVSRRALFTVPPLGYRPVVSIDDKTCVADTGCQQCTQVCPVDALSHADGRIVIDRAACTACGVCVTACPTAAVDLPGHSIGQLEAQVTELLANPVPGTQEQRVILFVCQRSEPALESLTREGLPYSAALMHVAMPCAGMVSTTMLLQCLAGGASAVSVVGCGDYCKFGQREGTQAKVEYCREILSSVGRSPDCVRFLESSAPPETLTQALSHHPDGPYPTTAAGESAVTLSRPGAAAEAVKLLCANAAVPLNLSHPASPLGVVDVDANGCTACGACARTCPTGALDLAQGDVEVTLTFDASLCTGCGQCVPTCPERVVSAEKRTDSARLKAGRLTMYEDRDVHCEACGASIGPAAMLRRVRELLSPQGGSEATISTVSRLCPSCRTTGAPEEAGSQHRDGGSRD